MTMPFNPARRCTVVRQDRPVDRRSRVMRYLLNGWLAHFLLSAATAAAAPSHLVADTTTPVLGISGTLDSFGLPAFSGQVVAFSAKRGAVAGIYADFFSGTPEVHKLAEINDTAPDGNPYFQFVNPAAGGNTVAFAARSGCCNGWSLYWMQGPNGIAQMVAHSGNYGTGGDSLGVGPGSVLYSGDGTQGIFSVAPDSSPMERLSIHSAGGAPGRIELFPDFTFVAGGIGATAEWVVGSSGTVVSAVVHAGPGQSISTVVADTNTTVPGTTEKFQRFQQPALDGFGNIAFSGQGPTRGGIYRYDAGRLVVVADTSMTDPLTHAKFHGLGGVVLDEGKILFLAQPEGYSDLTLYRSDSSGLKALYTGWADVTFDDGRTRTISMQNTYYRPAAVANHRLAVLTQFPREGDQKNGIVLLDLSGPGRSGTPEGGGGSETPPSSSKKEGCGGNNPAVVLPFWFVARAIRLWRRPK